MAREVFVSYSEPDRECAFELTEHVESSGIPVWIAPRDVSPSADWAEEIIDAISGARIMVLVFSSNSNSSPQVRREVERAVHKQLRVLPFRIEDVLPSRSLEYFLSAQHWLDAFPPPRAAHFDRLCHYLHAMLQPGSAAPASAAGTLAAAPMATSTPTTSAAALAAHSSPAFPASPSAQVPAAEATSRLDPARLQHVQRQLATELGPIAAHLMRRAAAGAVSLDELLQRLARELDSDAARRRFLERCRRQ